MIDLALSPSGDLASALTTALSGRAIDVVVGRQNDVHFFTAVAGAWRKVSRSASELVTELRQAEGLVHTQVAAEARPLQAALKVFLYDATEVFDLYQQAIAKRLEPGRSKAEIRAIRDYQATAKRLRDPVALMCNKLKHDHREIGSCLILSRDTALSTWVFRITAAYGGLQTADKDVHRASGFISYERLLHEVVHGLLRVDHNAGLLVNGLSDNASETIALRGVSSLGLEEVLADLGNRKPVCASSEPGRIDGLEVSGRSLKLCRLEVVRVPEPTKRMMSATVDEVARELQMFV